MQRSSRCGPTSSSCLQVMARPKVAAADGALSNAGLMPQGRLLAHFDARTEQAVSMLKQRLDLPEAQQVDELVGLSLIRAQALWDSA
eukprot:987963-Karenia_brevis.AAC.1